VEPFQILLVLIGLAVASGGIVMLVNSRNHSASARGPYVPIAVTFIGLMIAYRAFAEYPTLQPLDVVIMFLFLLALLTLLGVQFFIVDRSRRDGNDKS
jgi:peptidoglycan/LPS O-acetylase OafA/YrhL